MIARPDPFFPFSGQLIPTPFIRPVHRYDAEDRRTEALW